MRSKQAAEISQKTTEFYDPSRLSLPVRPGDKAFWVNTESGYIVDPEQLEIEGVVLMKDRICALIGGDVLEIGSDIFLTHKDAEEWADAHRRPSIEELLDAAGWYKNTPPESGTYYARFSSGDIQKLYYHSGKEPEGIEGYYSHRRSYSRIHRPVSEWTYVPDPA